MLETIGFSIGPRIEGPFSMYIDKLTSDDGKSNIKAACPLYLRASEYTTTRTKTAARKTTWDLNANTHKGLLLGQRVKE